MNICKVCSEIVPLVGGTTLRLTGEEDIYLCPKHGTLMIENVRSTVFLMRMNEATKSTAVPACEQEGAYRAVAK
jgi:hypothetical protein